MSTVANLPDTQPPLVSASTCLTVGEGGGHERRGSWSHCGPGALLVFPTSGVDGLMCTASRRLESHTTDSGSVLSGTAVVTRSETQSGTNGFSSRSLVSL